MKESILIAFMSQRVRLSLSLLLHLVALLGVFGVAWVQHRPVVIAPDAANGILASGEKFDCLSYSPYHLPGQTPLNPDTRVSRAQIAADLAILATVTRCVRIYAVSQGQEAVPEIARQLGLKVLLGAWIGYDPAKNREELETAIALAQRYPDVVRGLIVGNEVMLRGEQPEAILRALLDEARQRSPVPVTYADVWEFWLRHPKLAASVDFITVHILPYWEDEPVSVDAAIAHVAQTRQRIIERYGKPVLIGETGWPSAGRQRSVARPGRAEAARYLRDFTREARRQGWDYNLIEAIDQPWKRKLEGTVGGVWGLFTADMREKFPFSGAFSITPRPSLAPLLMAGGASAGILLALHLALWRKRRLPAPTLLTMGNTLVMGAWTGGMLLIIGEYGALTCRDAWEWGLLGGVALMGVIVGVSVGFTLAEKIPHPRRVPRLLALSLQAALAIAAAALLFDPRYRDFPLPLYLLPLPALILLPGLSSTRYFVAEALLKFFIVTCGVGASLQDPGNREAQHWMLLCFAYFCALACACPGLRWTRQKT